MSGLLPHRRKAFRQVAPVNFDGFGNASRSFDGTNDYIDIGDVLDSVTSGTGAVFTLTAWVKSTSLDDGLFFGKLKTVGDNRSYFFRITSTGEVAGLIYSDGGSGNRFGRQTSTSGSISADTWHHVAVIYDQTSTNDYLRMLIDGVEDTSLTDYFSSGTFVSIYDGSGAVRMSGSDSGTSLWGGNLADVRIYDTDLTASDVSELYTGTNVTTNLVGHWIKDTPSLLDHAGSNDATNYGSKFSYDNPSPAVEFGSMSRLFNGTNDYINLGDSLDSVFAGVGKKFTISAWIKTASLADTHPIAKYSTSGERAFLVRVLTDGNLGIVMSSDGSFNNRWGRQTDNAPISANTWHYISITYDQTATGDYLRIWVDGVEDLTLTDWLSGGTFTSIYDSTSELRLSGTTENSGRWEGKIADLRIYDTDLTSSDISDLYNGTNVTTNLVGHWLTNNDDVKDYAGVNDGTNIGSTYSYDNPNALVEYGGASRAFDGINQYIDIGDIDGSAWQGSNKKFSGSLWIKPFTIASNATIFNKAGNANNQYEWTVTRIGGEIRFIWAGSLNPTNYSLNQTTNSPLVVGEWIHFAFTYDGTQAVADRVKLYINGSQGTYSHTLVGTPSEIQNGTQPLCIGGEWVSNGSITNDYRGDVADVRLYDKDLTATEAYELYKGVDHRTNLIGQWLTNSDDVEDKAGTNDGTNFGSTYSTDSPL